MKTTSILFTVLSIFFCTFLSCDNDPYNGGCGLPPVAVFEIRLINGEGENLITDFVEAGKTFKFEKSTDGEIIPLDYGGSSELGNVVIVRFLSLEENTDYYINWEENDTDTLSFKWIPVDEECFDNYKLTEVKHNNVEIELEEGLILVQ